MISNIPAEQLAALDKNIPVIDVRTPAEFAKGHIPGAFNIPLFSNEERVQVGTTYKQVGREQAILLGFDLTGPKWSGFIKQALEISPDKNVAVHCWRGGMRSGAMAWALNLYGFNVHLITGGYKTYRRWVLDQFEKEYKLLVLGGFTGSGKTRVLHELVSAGNQVIDLEDLAQHQGSSYGTMGKLIQPSQEQFENDLAASLSKLDAHQTIWIEDESNTIGKCFIPKPLFMQIRSAQVIKLDVEREVRVKALAEEYGKLDKAFLAECTERIHKRLGPEQTRDALLAIEEGRMEDFVSLALVYYDKTYRIGLSKRDPSTIHELEFSDGLLHSLTELAARIYMKVLQQ
jgi:tRNA 2-selenouridine synthase